MSKLMSYKYITQVALLIISVLSLVGCYDAMSIDDPSYNVNRSYGFYHFYDNPYSYTNSPYYDRCDRDYAYEGARYRTRPRSRRYYDNQEIREHVYHERPRYYHYESERRYNHAGQQPRRHQPQNVHIYNNNHNNNQNHNHNNVNANNAGIQRQNAEARQHPQNRQAQINSDRALAQRLQNEEIAAANRARQIASDRALAERLQAEEFANAR